jgi:type IV pilus assembly protein PilE
MKSRSRGITLIELVIVIIIVGLLAAIAIPGYRQFVLRSHRAEAKTALMNLASAQERFYLQNNTYATNALLATAPPTGLGLSTTSENGWYSIAITGGDATSYSATATAISGQAADTYCATFTINQLGAKTATNADCWP